MLNHGTKYNMNTFYFRGASGSYYISSQKYYYNCQRCYTSFYKEKLCKDKVPEFGKNHKSKLSIFRGWKIQTQKIAITIIYISFKNLLTKNGLTYTYYINLDESIIRHQKLRLTCRE